VLFWKEYAKKVVCPKCNTSRWIDGEGRKSNIYQNVLWYFSIKLRLQRLFITKEMAKEMRCHKKVEKMMTILLDTQPIILCRKSLIKDISGLQVIPTTCGLV
jgi:hypothetical protein